MIIFLSLLILVFVSCAPKNASNETTCVDFGFYVKCWDKKTNNNWEKEADYLNKLMPIAQKEGEAYQQMTSTKLQDISKQECANDFMQHYTEFNNLHNMIQLISPPDSMTRLHNLYQKLIGLDIQVAGYIVTACQSVDQESYTKNMLMAASALQTSTQIKDLIQQEIQLLGQGIK